MAEESLSYASKLDLVSAAHEWPFCSSYVLVLLNTVGRFLDIPFSQEENQYSHMQDSGTQSPPFVEDVYLNHLNTKVAPVAMYMYMYIRLLSYHGIQEPGHEPPIGVKENL